MMIKRAVLMVACAFSVSALADNHEPGGPALGEVYDCQLNAGVSLSNAVEYAARMRLLHMNASQRLVQSQTFHNLKHACR